MSRCTFSISATRLDSRASAAACPPAWRKLAVSTISLRQRASGVLWPASTPQQASTAAVTVSAEKDIRVSIS